VRMAWLRNSATYVARPRIGERRGFDGHDESRSNSCSIRGIANGAAVAIGPCLARAPRQAAGCNRLNGCGVRPGPRTVRETRDDPARWRRLNLDVDRASHESTRVLQRRRR
jgi:hypothetical protein